MADPNNATATEPDPNAVAPPVDGGQADGSPLPDDQRPNSDKGDDKGGASGGAEENAQVLELRRKLTEMGEDKKAALDFANRVLADPKLGPQARAILEGRDPAVETDEADEERKILTDLVGVGNEDKLARLLELREKRLKGEFASSVRPLARQVVNGVQTQAVIDAAEEAGLDQKVVRSPAFKTFQKSYESQNSWMAKVKDSDPGAMATLVVSAFVKAQKRPAGRDPAESRNAALEHGGGGGARGAGPGDTEEFDPRAADAFQQISAIYKRGKTPVPKR